MIDTADDNRKILQKFRTLDNYEKWRFQWALICMELNPSRVNKKALEDLMYEKLELEVRNERQGD